MSKVIGVLGGMGAYATVDFCQTLLNLTVKNGSEHPRMIIDSNVNIPSRTRAVLYKEKSPAEGVIESINNLAEIGADFVVLPCNSVHYWYNEIIPKIKINWLNMIELITNRVKVMGFSKPLILGGYVTIARELYSEYIPDAQYLEPSGNDIIYRAITEIKNAGDIETLTRERLHEQLSWVEKKLDCDIILLACTELTKSVVRFFDFPVISSGYVYADETLRYAME